MGAIYNEDNVLGRRFAAATRMDSIITYLKNESSYSAFCNSGRSASDIQVPLILDQHTPYTDEADEEIVEDDTPCMEADDFLENFRDGDHRSRRPGVTPRMSNLECVLPVEDSECLYYVNYNHNGVENMDRLVGDVSKSFIPVDIGKSYLNEAIAYYQSLFGHLPNEYYAVDYAQVKKVLNIHKSMENIEKILDIQHRFIYKGYDPSTQKDKKVLIREVNYVTKDGILLFMSEPFNATIVIYDKPEQLDLILPNIVARKEKKQIEKPKFKLLVHNSYGFDCQTFDLKHFDISIEDNYNDDLPDKKIRHFIDSDSESGLCILHGKPGTGKTYYIRDLIKNQKREFIYMNKECLQYINDSSFIAFLVKNKNSVFIMEDCENVLVDRAEYNNTISTLLNLSDGLLGDSLNNKFICTFNTDISNIDTALLRKGRMKVCYEFKYLTKDKANKLAEKLNKVDRFDKDTPLCDIMNSDSNGNENIPTKKLGKIGF